MFTICGVTCITAEPSPVEAGNEEELTRTECEDQIPHLDDILKASFVSVCITHILFSSQVHNLSALFFF